MCHFLFVFLFILQHFIEREGEGRNRIYRQKHLPHLHIPPYIHDDVQIYITFLGIWYDRNISFGHHHSNRRLRQYWNCQILGLVSPLSCFRAKTDIKIKFLHPFFPTKPVLHFHSSKGQHHFYDSSRTIRMTCFLTLHYAHLTFICQEYPLSYPPTDRLERLTYDNPLSHNDTQRTSHHV